MSVMVKDEPLTAGMAQALMQMLPAVQMGASIEQAGNVIALHLALQRIADGTDVVAPKVADTPAGAE